MSSTYTMPDLCAKCADQPPATQWTIRQAERRLNPASFLTAFAGLYIFNRRLLEFTVPLCDSCARTMRRRTAIMRGIQVAGSIAMLLGFLLTFTGYQSLTAISQMRPKESGSGTESVKVSVMFNPGAPVMLLGVLAIGLAQLAVPYLGKYGKHGVLKFRNTTFHNTFAELNPDAATPRKQRGKPPAQPD